tara:strand:- start:19 stop:612 length:594 start_codon:yes stop_codon:yes gene_type:complete
MNITDAVLELPNFVSAEFCHRAIDFINFEDKESMYVVGGVFEDIRRVKGFHTFPFAFDEKDLEKNKKVMSQLMYFHKVRKQLEIPLINYCTKFPYLGKDIKLKQADFLEYSENGHYDIHTDNHSDWGRQLTVIINLNDGYEGGEFVFYNPIGSAKNILHKTQLKQGSVLMFPSNYLYPHKVNPIKKGKRYSIVCWLG